MVSDTPKPSLETPFLLTGGLLFLFQAFHGFEEHSRYFRFPPRQRSLFRVLVVLASDDDIDREWELSERFLGNVAGPRTPSSLVSRSPLSYADDMADDVAVDLKRFFSETAPKGVVSAYLFGSHSEARSHRESDVDVAVLLDRRVFATDRERFEERLRLIGAVGSALGRDDVDLVILNDVPPELGARIVTRGLRLSCSDGEADHAFVRDVQLRAADLAPFLRRMRGIKLEAIKR